MASFIRVGSAGNRVRGRGRLSRTLLAAIPALVLALSLGGCGKEAGAPGSGASAAPPPIGVTVLAVAPQRVPIIIDTVGQTEGAKQVEVRARVSGILEKQLYKEGDPVSAGSPLFQIDRAPFEIAVAQARAQLEQDKARTEQTQREEARLKPLAQDRAVSRKEYDDALSAAQLAAAAQQQSAAKVREAELNLSYTLVGAPLAGVTGRAERSVGTLITTDAAGSLLTTINQVNPIWVRFSLAESDLAKIPSGRLGGAGPVEVRLILPDGTPYPGKGRLNFEATAIDTKLGTQQLRAEFDNPKQQLLPGQFVRVAITAGDRDNVFLVPQAAVMQTEKSFLVFVVDADNKAALRTVQMGDWVGVRLDGAVGPWRGRSCHRRQPAQGPSRRTGDARCTGRDAPAPAGADAKAPATATARAPPAK